MQPVRIHFRLASRSSFCLVILEALVVAACSRSAPQAPPKPPPPPLEYLGEWGVKGEGPGQLSRPICLAVDFAGRVYVADAGNGFVHKFDPQGEPLLAFQETGLRLPTDIAVDQSGAIYVADAVRSSVFIFYPDGTRFRQIRCAHKRGSKESLGVTVDDDGNMFVVDPDSHKVQKFNPRGRLVKVWDAGDGVGEFAYPVKAAVGPDGLLYVVDARGNRNLRFTRDGDLVSAWGIAEAGSGEIRGLFGIAVSGKYVFADDVNHRVHAWTLDGQHKLSDNLGGRLAHDSLARDIAVSPDGELLVLDPAGPRVLRFRINF